MTYLHDATGGETLGISEFYIPEHRTRYNETRHRPILVCKNIFLFTLDILDLQDDVFNYFNAIG